MAGHTLRTDGGSRGNPGPAAAAFVLEDLDGRVVVSGGRFLGETTNNVAEYEALIWGLDAAIGEGLTELRVLADSELVVRQMCGQYRVKDEKLQKLHAAARQRTLRFDELSIEHVPRSENAAADALVNEALEERGVVGDAPPPDVEPAVVQEPLAPVGAGGPFELTVTSHFDAAHELHGYPGECRELHGHTWDVEVTVVGSELDDVGIVYDFKRLKEDLAEVLKPLDHAHINEVPPFDALNPTAENLARELCAQLQHKVGPEVRVKEVVVWESPIAKIVFRPE